MTDTRTLLGRNHGRSEADIILAALLGIPRSRLYTDNLPVCPDIEQRFQTLVAKRKTHTPLQYLTRTAPFLDLDLYVDERVFIPRPETEELVVRIFSRLHRPALIFDIGTGSAPIAIALARRFSEATVVATDCSEPALAVARVNIDRYRVNERVILIRADGFDFAESARYLNRVDLVVSNPPYIRTGDLAHLMDEVRDYEPRIALDGGPDGMRIIQPLVERSFDFLKPGGLLALEIDPGLVAPIKTLFEEPPTVEQDFLGHDRYLFACAPACRSADKKPPRGGD